jgi:rhodanese-related sulfurtransferase
MRTRIVPCAILLPLIALAAEMATVEPKEVAAQLQGKGAKPMMIHVGFGVMYRGKHIPQSIYAGPGRTPEGIESLKKAVAAVPKDREIVLYCGCCPWEMCPNVKPAMEALRQMGFTKVKAMMIPQNFAADWTDKGYPVELGEAAAKQ